ncbi:tetratricopeptide repeat protein [Bradyrhizobium sp. NP1]|uniref:tetratricopeptide repeat protein n=1 Tax=Bradyrhizobium sp. NP1 TaxID=3049772 RepID=UPI0025A66DB2|nr:tetratricopeptide repeat protein [Bradyrhizobium sp. NP1]WJR75853.1 tetratricopeptide repeat protein [Bradyrhizobium sp. NP1]
MLVEDFSLADVLTGAATKAVPSTPEAFRQASALHDAGRFDEAESVLRTAIARDPTNPELRNARGVMYAAMNRQFDAVCCYRDAIACDPTSAGIWTNLGNSLTRLRHLKSAIMAHRRAIALAKTDDPLLWHNLGASLAEAGQHGEAIGAFTRAIQLDPDRSTAKWDRGCSYLHLGNYRQAWPDYEMRRFTGQLPAKKLPGKPWAGEPYAGKRLVLVVKQGFGDAIWAARYLPKVKALGGELVMECQSELIPLIEGLGAVDRLIPRDHPLPEADFYCYLCSLPGLFTHEFASIPATPYFQAPSDRRAKFETIFQPTVGKVKVGIVWSGSVTFQRNSERAQPLRRFLQAFALPGIQLYSLQKGPPEQELRALPHGGPIIDLAPHIDDFADTAAAIAALDLVIMTDSAVAHLAGAMGKRVWVLLGHVAHWLWLLDRVESPWYPSLRLFRPRAAGDWDYVFDSASAELMTLAKLA